jgi:hypothetical protein
VVLLKRSYLLNMLSAVAVAAIAVVFMMALGAAKAISINMFLVPEVHFCRNSIRTCCLVHFYFRRCDRRVHPAHDIIGCRQLGCRSLSRLRLVAHAATFLAAPFPVAAQTLAMVRALESGLADIAALGSYFMTALACRVIQSLWGVVVTYGATTRHLGHVCMTLMIERYGKIYGFELA